MRGGIPSIVVVLVCVAGRVVPPGFFVLRSKTVQIISLKNWQEIKIKKSYLLLRNNILKIPDQSLHYAQDRDREIADLLG